MGKAIGEIFEEYDYSKFKKLNGNRDVIKARKGKILKSINEVGYVLNPIVVNKKMEIVDGQGRFEALKELGLPIIYVIDKNAGIKECIAMNIGQMNWRIIDYVMMYAQQGNQNYVRLLKALESCEHNTFDEVVGLLLNKICTNGYWSSAIKSGELSITEKQLEEFYEIVPYLKSCKEALDSILGSSRVKITAIAWILRNTDCDKARLISIINNKYPIIKPVVDSGVDVFLSQLADLCNKKLAKKNCIYFDTEHKKWLRGDDE
jgi:hypothetical protein